MTYVSSVGAITPPKLPSASLHVWIENKYSHFVWGPIEYNGHIP